MEETIELIIKEKIDKFKQVMSQIDLIIYLPLLVWFLTFFFFLI